MPKIGERIENFEFEIFHNNDIKKIHLHQFLGKWLIIFFYPADFTFICPTELEALADSYGHFKELGSEILSLSRDSAFVHKAWYENDKRVSKIAYPMGADVKGELTKYFDVFEESNGLSLRSTIIVSPEGLIKSIEINDNSIGRNIDEILRKLSAAIYTSKNRGEVCPVNWDKGKRSLKLPDLTILK